MSEPKEIDCDGTLEIVCPWCGYEYGDSWEFGNNESGIDDCQGCEKPFSWSRNISIDYSTEKIEMKVIDNPEKINEA